MSRIDEPLSVFRDVALRRRVMALCVCVLLLKLAVPLLAVWAARVNDVPVGEICSVYGFDALHQHHHHGAGSVDANHEDHCPLAGVIASTTLLVSLCALLLASLVWPARFRWQRHTFLVPHDGPRTWRSRLAHAPPAVA